MKAILWSAVLGAMLIALPPVARAESVTGEVVDLSCYLPHPENKRGASHRKCAEMCAKKGLPMGLLTEDGTVVLLVEDHGVPEAYATAIGKAGKTITVDGSKVTGGGMTAVVVEAVQ